MKIESHLENLKESIEEINIAIAQGLEKKQRTLGFHISVENFTNSRENFKYKLCNSKFSTGAIDILEVILHKQDLIDSGFIIKHNWFNSKRKINDKLPFDFPRKKEIIGFVVQIEGIRNKLCYGKRQEEVILEGLIENFNSLKQIFVEVTKYEL